MTEINEKIQKYTAVIEGLIFAADEPVSLSRLCELTSEDDDPPTKDEIKQIINNLREFYAERGVQLVEVASGVQFRVATRISPWLARLWQERPPKYSRAFLETLALIAYRQPITRGEIEEVRGVAVNAHIIRTLIEREWVKIVGHKDVPGKPALLATTKQFLDYFNLKSLNDLPPLEALTNLEHAGEQLEIALKEGESLVEVESAAEVIDAEGDIVEMTADESESDHTAECETDETVKIVADEMA